jgi:hypothetical protein
MSEKADFRSKRPFTLYYYPSSQFPPHAMSEDDACTLWCLIDGEDRPFPIRAGRNWEVANLPYSIISSKSNLHASIDDIFLWKVSVLLASANLSANLLSQGHQARFYRP